MKPSAAVTRTRSALFMAEPYNAPVSSYVPPPPPPPPRRRSAPRAGTGRGPHPLLVALGAAALAVLFVCGVGFAVLLLRGGRHTAPQEVVGAALPPAWVPGRGGAGQVP